MATGVGVDPATLRQGHTFVLFYDASHPRGGQGAATVADETGLPSWYTAFARGLPKSRRSRVFPCTVDVFVNEHPFVIPRLPMVKYWPPRKNTTTKASEKKDRGRRGSRAKEGRGGGGTMPGDNGVDIFEQDEDSLKVFLEERIAEEDEEDQEE